jgi:VWFA-related protein
MTTRHDREPRKAFRKRKRGSRLTATLAALTVAALLAGPAFAQEEAPPAPQEAPRADLETAPADPEEFSAVRGDIRVRVDVVNVPLTVIDRRGMPVFDLTKDDFRVFEDGIPQQIRYFSREMRPPLRIGLIVDTSNSARRSLQFQKDAASEFVFNMLQGGSSKHQIFLQTFDATSSIVQDFTNDPQTLNEKIHKLKAGGGKALYDAIYFACREKMMKAGPPDNVRRVLVVISDGRDVQSRRTFDEVVSMAHRSGTVIYALGNAAWGYDNPGDKILEQLADATGGAALFPRAETPGTDLQTGYLSHGQIEGTSQNKGLGAGTGIYSATRLMQLAESLDAIGRELNEQYTLAYTPTNSDLDGTFRTIRIEPLRKDLTLRYKPGYFASAEAE